MTSTPGAGEGPAEELDEFPDDPFGRDYSGGRDLGYYTGIARRRWWIVVLAAVLGVGIAGGYLAFAPEDYTATTSVVVSPIGARQDSSQTIRSSSAPDATSDTGPLDLGTEAQIVRSSVVAAMAKQTLRTSTSLPDLVADVTVTVPANTSVLAIAYTAGSGQHAQSGSIAFAQAYLANRSLVAQRDATGQVAVLQREQGVLQSRLTALAQGGALSSDGADGGYARAQQSVLQGQITDLANRAASLSTQKITPGSIITLPAPPDPGGPPAWLLLLIGAGAGLLLGAIVGTFVERGDHRVRRGVDVERDLGVSVLAEAVGALPGPGLYPFSSRDGQAFARLRNAVLAAPVRGNEVLLVAGASDGGGSGIVAAHLAAALARTGSDVSLICLDPESVAPGLLGAARGPGIVSLARVADHLGHAGQRVDALPRLRVVAAGDDEPASPDELVDAVDTLLAMLRGSTDHIVIEAPALSTSADAQTLSGRADAALLVIESRYTLREQVLEGAGQLESVGAPLLGAVIVPRPHHRAATSAQTRTPKRHRAA